jgi:chromosome segregation ATPase
VKKYSTENEEMAAHLEVYTETQEELTSELADFKEKYREIINLLHDTQNELKKTKKRSYCGVGTHKLSDMFSASPEHNNKGNGLIICTLCHK